MKVLFVCNQGKHRSKTAELLFNSQFETRSKGLFSEHPLTENDLYWADLVLVMEDFQRKLISEQFPKAYLQKRILSLDIPDEFSFNDPELIKILNSKLQSILAIH
jgi:predicted protein tyrosine phosphatase